MNKTAWWILFWVVGMGLSLWSVYAGIGYILVLTINNTLEIRKQLKGN